jgi:hypothetical protein
MLYGRLYGPESRFSKRNRMAGYCEHGIKISVFTKFVDVLASYASHRSVNFVLHGVSESFRMYY